jgi:hypothetical protein
MTKFVVAGTFEQYRNHIKKMSYNPNEYVYVSDAMQLRGRVNLEGFYIGTWQDRPDIEDIKLAITISKQQSKLYTTNSQQYLGTGTVGDPITHGLGITPSMIMLKQKGAWQQHDLKSNTITTIPIVDDV